MYSYRNILVKLLFILTGMTVSSICFGVQLTLVKSEHTDYREPMEVLVVKASNNIFVSNKNKLALELDSVDVSEMLKYESDRVIYTPIQPLKPGTHTIKLVQYDAESDMRELGVWAFEVRQSKTFKQYGAKADLQLENTYRLNQKNLSAPLPNREHAQGSAQVYYRADTGRWHTQGQFDLLYNSSNDGRFGPRKFDNGEFLFSVGDKSTELRVGHQTIGDGSMAMDGFRRRGVSLERNFQTLHARVTGFMLSSEDVVGFRRGLAVGDANRRVDGVNFMLNPFADETLSLSGTWLSGKQQDESGFVASVDDLDPATSKGAARSLIVRSQLLDSRLQLEVEYASSRFDSNAADSMAAVSDNAYHFKANYSDTSTSGVAWSAGLESGKTGPFFKSLGNQGFAADNQLLLASGGVQWSTVGVQASLQRQNDNVQGILTLPRIQTDLSSISMNWTPVSEENKSWLGTPSLDTTFSRQNQKQTLTPTGYSFPATNARLDNWLANASFSYLSGSWGLSLASNRLRDFSGIQNSSNTSSFGLNGTISLLDEMVNLSPSIQFDRTRDQVTNLDSDSIIYSIQSTFVLVKDKLNGSISLSSSQNATTDNSVNSDSTAASIVLNWHALESKPNTLGLDFVLSGQYNDTRDRVFVSNSLGTYEIFLTFSIVFPAQLGVVQ